MRCFIFVMVLQFAVLGQETPWMPANDVRGLPGIAGRSELGDGIEITGLAIETLRVEVSLELSRFQVFRPDSKIYVHEDNGVTRIEDPPQHIYLSGKIPEFPGSHVMLVIKENGLIHGLVDWEGRNWRLQQDSKHGLIAIDNQETERAASTFNCSSDMLNDVKPIPLESGTAVEIPAASPMRNRGARTATYAATIAVESDFEFFQLFGNSTDATDYIGELLGYSSVIYEAEIDTSISVGHVSLWQTSSDPWNQSNVECSLYQFGKYWNDNNSGIFRSAAHFFCGRVLDGGVAWLDKLCSPSFNVNTVNEGCTFTNTSNYGGAYAFSSAMSGTFNANAPTPTVWDIFVVAHEMGHNFGSPHTHCFAGIGGNASHIDTCYTTQPGCATGTAALPSGCPGAGNGCGTIMSYCHGLSGGYRNISLNFGTNHPYGIEPERSAELMTAETIAAAQANPSCLPTCVAPVISDEPDSVQACLGGNVSFSVTVTGAVTGYQWQKNSTNIVGATSATLNLTNIVSGDAGSYVCIVTNTCGTDTSAAATLSLLAATAISQNPLAVSACTGDQVSFSVTASGSNLTYQWRKGGQNIGGAVNSTYSIASMTSGDAGSYDCVVSGDCGDQTSTAAVLTFITSVSINTQPSTQTVCIGDPVSFSVTASGTNPSYQWLKNGQNIDGATSATYQIASAKLNDATTYHCQVSNACGSVNTQTAVLTVNPGTSITSDPENTSVCPGDSAMFTVVGSGQNLTYQWLKDGQTIQNATSATLHLSNVAEGDEAGYSCQVSGTCGTTVSAEAQLYVGGGVTIVNQPDDETRCENSSVTFNVSAAENGLTYQWRHNQVNIQGANSSSYTRSQLSSGDAGNYDCLIDDGCGAVTSDTAVLTIQAGEFNIAVTPSSAVQGLEDIRLDAFVDCGVPPFTYHWTDSNGTTLGDSASLILTNRPTTTTRYDLQVTDSNSATLTASATVLVNRVTPDVNGDGQNTIEDLLLVLPDWRNSLQYDANGDGLLDIRDLLYIPVQ